MSSFSPLTFVVVILDTREEEVEEDEEEEEEWTSDSSDATDDLYLPHIQCYYCKEYGHIIRTCPLKRECGRCERANFGD